MRIMSNNILQLYFVLLPIAPGRQITQLSASSAPDSVSLGLSQGQWVTFPTTLSEKGEYIPP